MVVQIPSLPTRLLGRFAPSEVSQAVCNWLSFVNYHAILGREILHGTIIVDTCATASIDLHRAVALSINYGDIVSETSTLCDFCDEPLFRPDGKWGALYFNRVFDE